MKVKTATPIRIFLANIRARWRVFLGFCPMCNSDAPAIDSCALCDSHRPSDRGFPSSETKQKWLTDYRNVLRSMSRTRKTINAYRNTKENI